METKNVGLAKGLQTIRKANVLSIVAVVIALISGVLMFTFTLMGINLQQVDNTTPIGAWAILAGGSGLLAVASLVIILISRIWEMVGLVRLSKINNGYKTAFLLIIISLVLSLATSLLPFGTAITNAITQTLNLLCVASVYFILNTTVVFLRNEGTEELAARGLRVRTLYVVCNVVAVAIGLVALLPALAVIADIAGLVTSVIQFVALIQYIRFLGSAATALKE